MPVLQGEIEFETKKGEGFTFPQNFLSTYGDRFTTFNHFILHDGMSGVIFVPPILSILALFELKSVN